MRYEFPTSSALAMRTYTPKKSRLQVESLEDRVALAGGFATLSSRLPAAEVRSAQGSGTVLPATARPSPPRAE